MLTKEGIRYCWKQIFKRLDLSYNEKEFFVNDKKVRYVYSQALIKPPADGFLLQILPCGDEKIQSIHEEEKINWISQAEAFGKPYLECPFTNIPILFQRNTKNRNFATVKGNTMQINVDVIATIFFFLTRYEEITQQNQDRYGRFPYQASVINKFSLIDVPIVDLYILLSLIHI